MVGDLGHPGGGEGEYIQDLGVGWSGVVRCGGLHCVRNFCQVVSVGREGRVAPVRSGGGL